MFAQTNRFYTLFFFLYKNLFYKNVEAEMNQNFKNVLTTFLKLRVDLERLFFANLYVLNDKYKIKLNKKCQINPNT